MASCIFSRDAIFGVLGQGNDWHGMTKEVEDLGVKYFPKYVRCPINVEFNGRNIPTGQSQFVTADDGLPVGTAQNSTFQPILPDRSWELIETALSGTKWTPERVGTLWNRSFWFASIHLTEIAELARPGEKIELLVSAAIDGSQSLMAHLSNTRVVCANTLRIAQGGDCIFKVKQSKNSSDKLEAAKADLEKAAGMVKVFNETLIRLEETPCTEDAALQIYAGQLSRAGLSFANTRNADGTLRKNRAMATADGLRVLFRNGYGNKGETLADVLNGATQFYTRGSLPGSDSDKNVWKAFESSEFGNAGNRKLELLEAISTPSEVRKIRDDGKAALKVFADTARSN